MIFPLIQRSCFFVVEKLSTNNFLSFSKLFGDFFNLKFMNEKGSSVKPRQKPKIKNHQHHPQQIGKMLITIPEKTHLGYYESGNKSILIIKQIVSRNHK
jgi:hypothetical protein